MTLIFILMIAFIGNLMESASIQMAKNYRRTDMDRAMESVFAEYQRELLDEFDVFGLEGSYETGEFTERQIIERLEYYGAAGIENQILAIELLTDNGGQAFREQIARYMESKYGLDFLSKWTENIGLLEDNDEKAEWLKELGDSQESKLEQLLTENGAELSGENNPLSNIKTIQNRPLMELVFPDGNEVSEGKLELSDTLSHRNMRSGYGTFRIELEKKKLSSLLFGEYLLEHFSSAADAERYSLGDSLQYEIEYILSGKASDKENVEKVINKLLLVRMVFNYAFVSADASKRLEAEAMAATLSTIVMLPEITEAVTQVLLLAWAFGESVIDLRSLLSGNNVALIKTDSTWQTSISSLLTLGTAEDSLEGRNQEGGWSYSDYLGVLLFLQEKTTGEDRLTLRTMDMVEKRLRYDKDLEWFRADACVSKLEIKSRCNLRRGITYQFNTYFGYR